MNTTDLKSFYYLESGEITYSELDTNRTEKQLDPGLYSLKYLEHPHYRVKMETEEGGEILNIHEFPDKDRLDKLFTAFFNKEIKEKIKGLGFYHKSGVLLYGKEGTGKSTIIKHYSLRAIKEHGALVFYINDRNYRISDSWEIISKIRKVQSNPIIIIFEELDVICKEYSGIVKTMLDGNLSIDNSIVFGTTNFIDDIPESIKDRPSRFKYSLNIEGIHNIEDIITILTSLLPDASTDEIEDYAEDLKGNTVDYIKQFAMDKIMGLNSIGETKVKIGFKRA